MFSSILLQGYYTTSMRCEFDGGYYGQETSVMRKLNNNNDVRCECDVNRHSLANSHIPRDFRAYCTLTITRCPS